MILRLFEDWFLDCFIHQVRGYCLGRGIPLQILLLLDNMLGHPLYLANLIPDVKVVFFAAKHDSIHPAYGPDGT